MNIITELKQQILTANAIIREIQEGCSHPIIARHTENKGSSGNYDDPKGSYWTVHTCKLCEKQWHTDQNWKNIDNGLGLPQKG
jgi:hypothetical protein